MNTADVAKELGVDRTTLQKIVKELNAELEKRVILQLVKMACFDR